MYRDALQVVDLDVVRAAIAGREHSLDGHAGDPERDLEARLIEMDRLGLRYAGAQYAGARCPTC